jgi:hypothetical protein
MPTAPEETPIDTLARLTALGDSGEFISVSACAEVHVYLLEGRVAWATSSLARNAFSRRLVEHHGVSADTLKEVLAECQRARLRFGETLVGWGIATVDQVRDALAAQITDALATLAEERSARTLFLPRRMEYSLELTFGFAEVVGSPPAPPPARDLSGLVDELARSLPESPLWVQAVMGGTCGASFRTPSAPDARGTVLELAAVLAADGARSLTVRTVAGAVLGQSLGDGGDSVWCGLRSDAKLGLAAAMLAGLAGRERCAPPAAADATPGVEQSASPGPLRSFEPLRALLGGVDDLLGIFAVRAADGASGWALRPRLDLDGELARIRRYAPLLDRSFAPVLDRRGADADERGALRVESGGLAMLGTAAAPGTTVSTWIVLGEGASPGLGWALLQSVARHANELVVRG